MPPSTAVGTETGRQVIVDQVAEADDLFSHRLSSSSLADQEFGRWTIAWQLPPLPPAITLRELRAVLQAAQGRETGWPIGVLMEREDLRPKTGHQMLEAWLFMQGRLGPGLDYWLAKPTGFFYQTRAFPEDLGSGSETRLPEWIRPIWVAGEPILYARRFVRGFGRPVDAIRFFTRYQGLKGRILWNKSVDITGPFEEYACHTDEWSNEIEIPADIEVGTLPDVVHSLLDALYEQFDLFEMPTRVYDKQLERMLRDRM